MRTLHSRGVTRIELMVLVLVIAVSLAIVVMSVQSARGTGRRTQCHNNMRNIGLVLLSFQTSHNHFPRAGTFHDDPEVHQGDPLKSTIYRAITNAGAHPGDADSWLYSWVIDCSPYFDNADYYNAWDKQRSYLSTAHSNAEFPQVTNSYMSEVGIGVLRCPADPTAVPGRANLSYVVNGGFARWPTVPIGWTGSRIDGRPANGAVLQWAAPGGTWQDNQAIGKKLGVMFLGTHTGKAPWDVATTLADIADGAANTLLVGENTLAGYAKGTPYSGGFATNYACPLPNFAMFLASDDVCRTSRAANDCTGGQLRGGPGGSDGKGWSQANQTGTFENINFGQYLSVEGSFPFANSGHRGGCNFVFCDGAGRFVTSTIDGAIYAELISPAGTLLPPQFRQSQVNANGLEP